MFKYFNVSAPGHNVRCKLYGREREEVDKAILFCSGFAGHKDNAAAEKLAESLLSKQKNLIVVAFDWPSHGDDVKKKLTLEDCSAYLDLMIDAMKTKYGARELYAYAVSFGAYLILKYLSERENPFQKIAFRCPAVDMYNVLTGTIMKRDDLDRVMKGKSVEVGFDRKVTVTRELLESLHDNDIRQRDYLEESEKILILHGTSDEVVPFDSAKDFADDQLIEFVPVPGADHRFIDPVHMSFANKTIRTFFGLK